MGSARRKLPAPLTAGFALTLVVATLVGVGPSMAQTIKCKETVVTTCEDPAPSPSPSPSPSPEPPPSSDPSTPPPSGGGSQGGSSGGGSGGSGGAGTGGGAGDANGPADQASLGRRGGASASGIDLPFMFGGPGSTQDLLLHLRGLDGASLERALLEVVGPFPVAGPAWWTNDWHACRDGCARLHKGLDIFAPRGTPLVAAADGVVTQKAVGDLAGLYVEIRDAAGVEYFYAHLDAWNDDVSVGDRVSVGDVLGYVGNTGNAISTPTHVHFEIQPGGVPVPPKPLVDRWLSLAEQRAASLAGSVTPTGGADPAAEGLDFRLGRLVELGEARRPASGGAEGLWMAAGLQPGATLEVTQGSLERMAWEIRWDPWKERVFFSLAEDYGGSIEAANVAPLFVGEPASSGGADGHD